MIIKYHDDSYMDVDAIQVIVGNYESKDKTKWTTLIGISGGSLTIEGEVGKNVMDAYKWKNRTSIYDMRPSSKDYRQQIKGEV